MMKIFKLILLIIFIYALFYLNNSMFSQVTPTVAVTLCGNGGDPTPLPPEPPPPPPPD